MCGFFNMCLCVCECGFCNVCVSSYVCVRNIFVISGYFRNICTCIVCTLLFILFGSYIFLLFFLYQCKYYCHRVTTQLQ